MFSIEAPESRFEVTIYIGSEPYKHCKKWRDDNKFKNVKIDKEDDFTGDGVTFAEENRNHYFIWLRSFDGTPYSHSILAHETLHVVLFDKEHKGVKALDEAHEHFCYTQQFLIEQILRTLEEE